MAGHPRGVERYCQTQSHGPRNARTIEFSKCLRRHYRDELGRGGVHADMAVVGNLFRIATSEGLGAVIPARFWLKTRVGWRGSDRSIEVTPDQPITIRWATEADAAA